MPQREMGDRGRFENRMRERRAQEAMDRAARQRRLEEARKAEQEAVKANLEKRQTRSLPRSQQLELRKPFESSTEFGGVPPAVANIGGIQRIAPNIDAFRRARQENLERLGLSTGETREAPTERLRRDEKLRRPRQRVSDLFASSDELSLSRLLGF